MDRIKRISIELLENNPDRFTNDFEKNKQAIKEIAIVRSKVLRNRIAGFITSVMRRNEIERERQASMPEEENEDNQVETEEENQQQE